MKKQRSQMLSSWIELNAALRDCNEEACRALLKEELADRRRKQFMLRIHSRLNKVRADAERENLIAKAR